MKNLFKKSAILGLAVLLGTNLTFVLRASADTATSTASSTEPSADTTTDANVVGMESCVRATRLASRFGAFTALDPNFQSRIATNFLEHTTDFLKDQIKDITGINLDYNRLRDQLADEAGNFVNSNFNNLVGNPLRSSVESQVQALRDEARRTLGQLANNVAQNATSRLISSLTTVPTSDSGVLGETQALNRAQQEIIAEQKRSEVLADTRQKCDTLLRQTEDTIKRALLYQLSTQIVDWIQTGRTPQFIKQPGKFLEDTGRLAVDRLISRVAPQLCQPFRLSVQIAIPTTDNRASPFYEQVSCTLPQVLNNVEAFYNDFRSGGWIGYQEIWKPQNNFYGAFLMTYDETLRQQAAATDLARSDLAQGRGARSQTQCTEWVKYEAVGPSDSTEDIFDLDVGGLGYNRTEIRGATEDGEPPETDLIQVPSDASLENSQFFSSDFSSYFWQCERSEITNPGTVAASLTERATQTDIDYLANSPDIENFITAIEDAITNKLVKLGVRGLQNLLPNLPAISP